MIKITNVLTHIYTVNSINELLSFYSYVSVEGRLQGYIELIAMGNNTTELIQFYNRLYGLQNNKYWTVLYTLPIGITAIHIYARYRIPYQSNHTQELWLQASALVSSNDTSQSMLSSIDNSIEELHIKLDNLIEIIETPETSQTTEGNMIKIVYRDSNVWSYNAWTDGSLVWNSVQFGQHQTGSIVAGNFTLNQNIFVAVGGHGDTSQSFVEVLSAIDNAVLISHSLSSLILVTTNGAHGTADKPLPVRIDTTAHTGKLARLRVRDNHSGGNGWASVNFGSLIIE